MENKMLFESVLLLQLFLINSLSSSSVKVGNEIQNKLTHVFINRKKFTFTVLQDDDDNVDKLVTSTIL